ncbi:E3 ubiquitin-protein ligase TRIM33-like [Dendronephthya gigantea]|uniref:E3 ubiquitin-protein ligase TRIM33-like n=1 Tax=Dendronephthya gigantea TaxID=151771 RepID=UPI00106D902C|nr:E3 ubiquitin-protein ligase TRIM33-like [Dendronephthya gigantea]
MAVSLTSSRSIIEIHNLLVCDICKKTISEPKTLSCSHSFCKTCVENLSTQDEDVDDECKKLVCPTCKTTTTLKPDETVSSLPDSKFIAELLTAVGPDRNEETSLCSYCHKETSIATCMDCGMIFCHTCHGFHDTWPANKSHNLLSLSEIINRDEQKQIVADTLRCTATGHETAIPEFYCETCKELICIKCVASVHTKPGHTCIATHEIYVKQQEALRKKCATISEMLAEENKALETFKETKVTYEKNAKDIKVKHAAQKDEMMKIIEEGFDKVLEKKLEEVDQVFNPACEKLSSQIEMISNYVEKVEKSLQRTNDVLENSKLEELLSAQKIIDDDIRMLRYLSSFQVQQADTESCMEMPRFYETIKELAVTYADAMPDTVILKKEKKLFEQLLSFLHEKKSPLKLCYRASLHGWQSQKFHQLCDGKTGTVVLVKVGTWIFGGYTDQTWNGQYAI